MKQSREMDHIQDQMRSGVITQLGFLGSDTRNLRDIIEQDDATVRRLSLTHERIAARLSQLREEGRKGLGIPIKVGNNLEVRVDSVRGKLPCPFLHKGLIQKTFIVVTNTNTGAEITFTDLNIHMIDAHGFYEGSGSPYRLEPERLVRELNITA